MSKEEQGQRKSDERQLRAAASPNEDRARNGLIARRERGGGGASRRRRARGESEAQKEENGTSHFLPRQPALTLIFAIFATTQEKKRSKEEFFPKFFVSQRATSMILSTAPGLIFCNSVPDPFHSNQNRAVTLLGAKNKMRHGGARAPEFVFHFFLLRKTKLNRNSLPQFFFHHQDI